MPARKPLSDRLRTALAGVPRVVEKKMFGGTMFMVGGKMCVSARPGRLMCRIDPALHDRAIKRRGARTVKMNGRAYRGFVHVREDAVATKRELDRWVKMCLDFNKRAKRSRS
jgi:TfoX/Sxy family transcriptional regulator of competence genes